MRANTTRTNPALWPLAIATLLIAALLFAGAGTPASAKKKKKKCPAGTHKVVIKKKNGKKKKRCVANPAATPTPPAAKLAISPAAFVYPDTQHGTDCPADPGCVKQPFTVTNSGGASSGALAATIQEVHNPEIMGPPGYTITANTCTSALPAGASCVVTVGFGPNSNAGDQTYTSILHVTGAPGGDTQASLSGFSQ